jgi:hypothetical protein
MEPEMPDTHRPDLTAEQIKEHSELCCALSKSLARPQLEVVPTAAGKSLAAAQRLARRKARFEVPTPCTSLAKVVGELDTETLTTMQRSLQSRLTDAHWADHPDLAMCAMAQSHAIGIELLRRDLLKKVTQ